MDHAEPRRQFRPWRENTMQEVGRAYEAAIHSAHRGTRIAFWVVSACASILFILVLR